MILPLHAAPTSDLADALERFEQQFTYPLGPGRFFRISHGTDYPRFFRAMGEAACFVRLREDRVLGVLGAALCKVWLPNGEDGDAVYLGDLKIDPAVRGGLTLPRLADAAKQWVGPRAGAAFGVVMDGTPTLPSRYTGRFGIPQFQELGKIIVLRLSLSASADPDPRWLTTETLGNACYRKLSIGRYACPGGFPAVRSEIEARWLMAPDGRACGRLEDTRRAKRLIADNGVEMQSAHLSCFAYADVQAGIAILQSAAQQAARCGFPALFVSFADADAPAFYAALAGTAFVVAPATIFGTGLEPGLLWNINTAEI
jgi:hypothetical protein